MLELSCEGLSCTSPPIWATLLPQGELVGAGGCVKQQQQMLGHPGPRFRPAWALWWGSKSLELGGGTEVGREGNTDFSFKAKGELCQLTVSTCAGSLTWQWEQAAGDSRPTSAAFLL